MSGFDENPFGAPNINDPFSDPSIRRAVSSTPVNRGLEDYNPFAEQGSQGTAQVRGASNPPMYGGVAATQQPATLQPSTQEPPATNYARTPQQTVNAALGSTMSPTSDQRSEPDWKARTEEDIRSTSYYPQRYNWPPLPDKCCFQPCFYQDIDVEIQTNFHKTVRQLYRLWMCKGNGIILAITMFDNTAKGIFVGFLLLLIALCFVLAACGDLLLLTKIHKIYRSSDASVSKAQQEFATTFLRNEHVQGAASNVAATAVRAQMANAANQPRY
ncbi:Secretory carrier-associated membrane protein 2 [Melipona quadrifasciata]|uniref:Secretory carrier-associated membrane protein n=1 Tax=Melipona quadrifasciata TaxID=166423 RepID=A0A0N0BCV8_9HYME|nr:Secretory carrier-associated membrane protein 2 [Melipona quadrifasciata]